MTPRQAADWAALGFSRKRTELAEALTIATMAERDKGESINRQLKEWTDA